MYSLEETIGDRLPTINFEEHQLQDLQNYRISGFCQKLHHNTSFQQHAESVGIFLQECLDEYCTVSNAPDGVHNIIPLYDDRKFGTGPHVYCIEEALLQAKLVKLEDIIDPIRYGGYIKYGALQRPFKISQIVNAMLPPLIQDEEGSDNVAFNDCKKDDSILLPLNSLYLQANIKERQIEFILNKVVKEASSETHVELFTIHERIIEIDDLRITIPYILWCHYQLLEAHGHLDSLITCCQDHEGNALSLAHYMCFTTNMTNTILSWVRLINTLRKNLLMVVHM